MAAHDVRSLVSDLVFQLYDRALHPELFEVVAARTVSKPNFLLTVQITRIGHVISWQSSDGRFVQVMAHSESLLPTYRSLMMHRMRGEKCATLPLAPRLNFQTSFQVENLPEEIYGHVHDELLRDGLKRGFLYSFRAQNRLVLAPLAYVIAESTADNLLISTFHTFPVERTIVKTQSLIEHRQ